jgi:hypothetical protein
VPLADRAGGVTAWFQDFGDGPFVRVQAVTGARTEGAGDADAIRITAGEQCGAGGGAHGLGGVKVGEPNAFLGEAIDVGRSDFGCPKASDVGVPEVVAEDHDDIGRSGSRRGGERDEGGHQPGGAKDQGTGKRHEWMTTQPGPGRNPRGWGDGGEERR